MKKVLCAGLLMVDVLVKPVDCFDHNHDTVAVDTIKMESGGDAMNNAVILAKLGAPVCFAGRIGDDMQGEFLREFLKKANVEAHLTVDDKKVTSSCIVMISSSGERSFLYNSGANAAFCANDISDELLAQAGHIQIGGALSMPSLDGEGALSLLKRAKRYGLTTSMDVTTSSTGKWYETLRPVLPFVDYFMPSLEEAKYIAGTDEPDKIADFLLDKGVGTAVIKLGAKGCLLKNKYVRIVKPAYEGLSVMDTTGAGDAFCAGFIYGIVNAFDLELCASLGNAVAGLNITKIGATGGAVDWHSVQIFMENHN